VSARRRVALTGALAAVVYLTRYNGLFLMIACLIGIMLLDYFKQRWRERLVLSAIFIALFLIASSPWLIANYNAHGSAFYNTNYQNTTRELSADWVASKTNPAATRALAERFHSFGDAVGYDPGRLTARYPMNLNERVRSSFATTLVNQWVAWMAWLG